MLETSRMVRQKSDLRCFSTGKGAGKEMIYLVLGTEYTYMTKSQMKIFKVL